MLGNMMQPDEFQNDYNDDQPYLSPVPDPKQGHNQYYSPSQKEKVYAEYNQPYRSSKRHSKKDNSKLGLISTNNGSETIGRNIPYTATLPRNCCSGTSDEEQRSCAVCARVFVCIVGICNSLAGLFLIAVALGVLGGEIKSKVLGGLSTVNLIILAAGFAVVLCSVILMIAAFNHTKPHFKVVLTIFSVLLIIASLLELATVGLTLWSHSVIAHPANKDGTTAARLLSWSNQMANTTYVECCVTFTPPYSGANATLVDGICQWPESTLFIKDSCADTTNVLVCACQKGFEQYESMFGLFLRQSLTWTATALFMSAVMSVGALIAICTLMRPEHEMVSGNQLNDKRQPVDVDMDASIYAS